MAHTSHVELSKDWTKIFNDGKGILINDTSRFDITGVKSNAHIFIGDNPSNEFIVLKDNDTITFQEPLTVWVRKPDIPAKVVLIKVEI